MNGGHDVAKKHQLGKAKPKSNSRTKSRIHKASSNSGGGFNTAAGKGGPGTSHESSMTGGGGY